MQKSDMMRVFKPFHIGLKDVRASHAAVLSMSAGSGLSVWTEKINEPVHKVNSIAAVMSLWYYYQYHQPQARYLTQFQMREINVVVVKQIYKKYIKKIKK